MVVAGLASVLDLCRDPGFFSASGFSFVALIGAFFVPVKTWRRIKGYARTTSVQACCGSLHAAIVKRGLHNSTEWEVSRYLPRRPAGVAESRSLVLSHVAPACAVYLFFASLVDGRGCFGGVVRNLRLTKQTITGERNRVL